MQPRVCPPGASLTALTALTAVAAVRYNDSAMASSSNETPIIQMAGITKTFPGVVANDDVSLAVLPATIHAIIGENGAGKSTLMGILYGRFQPDRGRIRIAGEDVRIDSPARAIRLGIGMVTQHTTMIGALTVLENIVLGAEPSRGGWLNWRGRSESRSI
jgi:simple sugar transport system ATP-binding protein